MTVAATIIIVVFLFVLPACFTIFLDCFHKEISDYIKACTERKRNQKERLKLIEDALRELKKTHDAD